MTPARTLKLAVCAIIALLVALAPGARAQVLSEGFENVNGLPAAGWVIVNDSVSPQVSWFQGNSGIFSAQAGTPGGYLAANFLASAQFDLRLWLITPELPLSGGETLTFHTRAELIPEFDFADGLSVRIGVGSSTALANFSTASWSSARS